MNITQAADICYSAAQRRSAKLYALSQRMIDRATGNIQAAKLTGNSVDFRAIARKAARQLNGANRLQEWAEARTRRAGV